MKSWLNRGSREGAAREDNHLTATGSNCRTFGKGDRIDLLRKGLGKAGLKKPDGNRSRFHKEVTFGLLP